MTPLSPSPRDKPTSCWALPAKLKMKAFFESDFLLWFYQFLQIHNGKNQEFKYLKMYNAYTNSYKKYCSCEFWIWEKRYQYMFQPVEAFFLSDTLENTFLKCLNTIYVEGAYTRTLNFESGPASENNLESGKVTRGHRNLRSWPKKFQKYY